MQEKGQNLLDLDKRATLRILGSLPLKQPCAELATLCRIGGGLGEEAGGGNEICTLNSGCSGWLCHLEVSSLYNILFLI